MAAKTKRNIAALTMLPQGWVSASKHQCTTAITTMWTEFLWTLPESYTAMTVGSCARVMVDNGSTKGLNSTTKISFCAIIGSLCHCMIAIMTVEPESL